MTVHQNSEKKKKKKKVKVLSCGVVSQLNDVDCLGALLGLLNVKLDLVTLVQAGPLGDCAGVDENVLLALDLYEAEVLHGVVPLDCAFHFVSPPQIGFWLLIKYEIRGGAVKVDKSKMMSWSWFSTLLDSAYIPSSIFNYVLKY